MVNIKEFENTHLEFIKWLTEKQRDLNIDDYLSYVNEKLEVYKLYKTTGSISYIDELPRSMNRYLDEFEIDYETKIKAYEFIERMEKLLERDDS